MARYADIDDLIINKSHCDRDGSRFVYCDDIEPTADVRENVHAHLNKVKMKSGEWWHTCSKCIATWGSEDGELDFNYCPNCGAQFDERSEDDAET